MYSVYCVYRLRSADPHSGRSRNRGFVWAGSVEGEELQQALGVSVRVTVNSRHFREPLTFTCDGKTLTCNTSDLSSSSNT